MYLADDASGSNELFVASTSSSHSQLTVPAGTLAGGRSFVLVYCENALGRATSAASVAFSDWALSVPSHDHDPDQDSFKHFSIGASRTDSMEEQQANKAWKIMEGIMGKFVVTLLVSIRFIYNTRIAAMRHEVSCSRAVLVE